MHVLDNEDQELYKDAIESSGLKYQMVPPNVHRRNSVERAIHTFREHFLRVLAGVDPKFPMLIWDHLIKQIVITLNLL